MTITVNNQQVEAYDLLLKKEYALEILSGKKKVEYRSFSNFYQERFFDKEIVARNKKNNRKMSDVDFENEFKDIWYIHFHNYNNSWYLDVAIETLGMCIMDSQDINALAEEYPTYFDDVIEEARQNDKLPVMDRPMMFYIVLDEIVGTNL